jgi:hypothetical protein
MAHRKIILFFIFLLLRAAASGTFFTVGELQDGRPVFKLSIVYGVKRCRIAALTRVSPDPMLFSGSWYLKGGGDEGGGQRGFGTDRKPGD